MLIWTGTATVTNGDATVVVDTGPGLTSEVVAHGAMVVLDGVVYFADSLTDTSTLEMTRVYAGSTGTVDMEIWPVSQDTTNLVSLAQIVARTQAQINILDKNSQGLFFNMKGVTGAADPGPGFIAFDDDDATLVTEAYIDALDANGRAVSELVALWEAGTTIVIRSLSTAAYRAYTVATNTPESGYADLALTYVGHDGVLADNEALSISWSRAAAGLEINASGNFADRDLYDDEPAGFVFLSADGDGDTITVGTLFRKNSGTTADWGPAVPFQGPDGDRGWSPVFAVVNDGARRVLRLVDYVGGEGTEPTEGINQYVSSGGLTGTIGSATDIRGPQGAAGADGSNGTDGADGVDGADGTDPGALFNWDDGTTDADPGAGNMRADSSDLSAATFLYVSKEGRTGDDLENFLLSFGGSTNPVKGHVTLTSSGGNAQAIVGVSSLTDATNYVKIGIAASSHSGATGFVDATQVSLQFSRAGNQGTTDAISLASSINAAPEVTSPDVATKFAITDPDNGDILSWISFESLSDAIKPRSVVEAKTANYTVTTDDIGKNINVDASAASRAINLPAAATAGDGFEIGVRKSDSSANTVTIDGDGSETINGATTLVLRSHRESVRLVSTGTAWVISNTGAAFLGDTGTGGGVGSVPSPAAGDAAAGKVLGAGGGWVVPASVPRGHKFGLVLTRNGTDAVNDIDTSPGEAASTDAAPSLISLASSITKRLDAAWTVGSGNGGLDTGFVTDATYYGWLIKRSDTGVVDVLYSLSNSAPTMPSNYDLKALLGRVVRASSSNGVPQNGRRGSGAGPDVILEDQKASGTNGGTFTTGAQRTRDLNTVVFDPYGYCSLSSNQFTLPAGVWAIDWACPSFRSGYSKSWLYSVTATANVANSRPAYNDAASNAAGENIGSTVVTLAASTTFEIRHQGSLTRSNDGFGTATSLSGNEVYTAVKITRMD